MIKNIISHQRGVQSRKRSVVTFSPAYKELTPVDINGTCRFRFQGERSFQERKSAWVLISCFGVKLSSSHGVQCRIVRFCSVVSEILPVYDQSK